MTTKPKTRKAPAANGAGLDPVFAAIAEHQAKAKESTHLEKSYRIAVDKAEKKYGDRIEHHRRSGNRSSPNDWPGSATTNPLYDLWNRAGRAESQAAIRMARTKPTTAAGAAAMITHARREIETASESAEDWVTIALKTAAAALRSQVCAYPGRQTHGH